MEDDGWDCEMVGKDRMRKESKQAEGVWWWQSRMQGSST